MLNVLKQYQKIYIAHLLITYGTVDTNTHTWKSCESDSEDTYQNNIVHKN